MTRYGVQENKTAPEKPESLPVGWNPTESKTDDLEEAYYKQCRFSRGKCLDLLGIHALLRWEDTAGRQLHTDGYPPQ